MEEGGEGGVKMFFVGWGGGETPLDPPLPDEPLVFQLDLDITFPFCDHPYAATVDIVSTPRAPAPENLATLLPNTESNASKG